ncbi:transposon-transfer assisting family protein [Listeria booriae]|uniref:transposon-transfer assisting family protein n=1 Tax=Listeria booriae TaxID=1552123 RepID=UPI0028805287|nr:transposon-transfer assisting family protein [Listeria booriae]MDT0109637.1 transposon-transfer assisting family protein [Listeria booriae]
MGLFTIDEENLIALFDVSTREKLLAGLEEALPYVYNSEMMEIINRIIGKLKTIDDETYNMFPFDFTAYYDAKND